MFIGWAHDATDSYTVPFAVLAVVNLVAAVIITFARPVPSIDAAVRPAARRLGPDGGRPGDQNANADPVAS